MTIAAFLLMFAASANIASLDWLAGAWRIIPGATAIEEHWTKPAGGTMIGMGRTVAGGKTREFEYLRIEQRGESLVYIAQPGGRPGTEFPLASVTENELVFENLKHDFPTRIIYRRNSDGSVTARIEGGEGLKKRSIEFQYRRP